MLVFKTSSISDNPNLETLKRDQLLSGDNTGVRFLFDSAFGFSYAGGAPANGVKVGDVAEHADGSFVLSSGQAVAYNGNGFDLSTLTGITGYTSQAHVLAPGGVWSGIAAAQQFIVCAYLRLPAEVDWNTESSILTFFASSLSGNGYGAVADPLTIGFRAAAKSISFRRQTAVGAQIELTCVPDGHYGKLAQVAFWRNAAGTGARIKSAGGLTQAVGVAGALNVADIAACQPRFGNSIPFNSANLTGHRAGRKYRLFRGFVENLAVSGRDPVAVLDADYARTIARGVFS